MLPFDIAFDSIEPGLSACSPSEYLSDLKIHLLENIRHAAKFLGITREKMVKQYNKNLHFIRYAPNNMVWLHKVSFRKVENAKLSPRRTGPWKVIEVLANGLNFRIEDDQGTQQVVHHNRLSPVRKVQNIDDVSSNDSDSDEDGTEPQLNTDENQEQPQRRYPQRNRKQTEFYGAVPYDSCSD